MTIPGSPPFRCPMSFFVIHFSNTMAVTLKQRAYAGIWFMAAGIVPVLTVNSLLRPIPPSFSTFEFALWFMAAPLLVIGINGALFGSGILDSSIVKRGWQAALRGLLVSVITFLSLSVILSVWDAYTNEYTNFARTLILVIVVGFLSVGWWIAIVGTFAGWLLYQWNVFKQGQRASS